MTNVVSIFPANDFSVALESAAEDVSCGLIIGYDDKGELVAYGGGILDGRQPVNKDWLWIIESFKANLIDGRYDN